MSRDISLHSIQRFLDTVAHKMVAVVTQDPGTNYQAIESSIAATANRVTGAGSVMTLLGWLTSSNAGMWMGVLIGISGLLVNWYFKRRSDKRAQDVHEAYMRKLQHDEWAKMPTKPRELDE